MIPAAAAPERRRRRRPAVSCSLCRRRKIRCNRESPCSNCLRSKSEPCVYENDTSPQPPENSGVTRAPELDVEKASREHSDTQPPDVASSRIIPSFASKSVPSSSKRSWSGVSYSSTSEVQSMKTKIRRLEEELSRLTQGPLSPSHADARPNIERTTSQIAGVFHVNHESRVGDDPLSLSRSVIVHKSRLFGPSHWAQGAALFRDIFDMIEPHMRESSKAKTDLKKCKDLGRIIKAQRTPQWPTPPTSDLPPKGIADELVDCYLQTFETTFRILHIPTFRTEYDSLWVSDAKPSTAFTVQLKLVLAIGAITYDEQFSMRASAVRWVYEAHTWLSDPDFKSRLNIQSLQSSILLLIARELINVGGDSSWISAGALLRTALYMGLHRDPSHLPSRTALAAEMRRRLWNTILELCVQSSMFAGGAPLISLDDFDTEPPGNFDDDQLLAEGPVPKADNQFTQTSIARVLRKSFAQRLAIAKFLNDLSSYGAYEEALRLDADIRTSYRAICRTLREFRSSRGPSPSPFTIRLLDFITHFYISCLHVPFFDRSLHQAQYAFSRKVLIESCLKIWCIASPSAPIMAVQPDPTGNAQDQTDLTRLVCCGFGFFRVACMLALMFISLELRSQLQDEESLGPNPYRTDLFAVVTDAKVQSWQSIEAGETNIKGYILICLINAQIEGLMKGVEKDAFPALYLKASDEAQERCIAFLEEKVHQGYNGESQDLLNQISVNTTPAFMGDWEFLMSDAFFNMGSAEPISWVLNHESRPFMM